MPLLLLHPHRSVLQGTIDFFISAQRLLLLASHRWISPSVFSMIQGAIAPGVSTLIMPSASFRIKD